LRECRVGVDVLAKEVLDHADTYQRAGFLTGDTVGLAGPTLEPVGDVALHHVGGHTGIKGQDLNRRDFELGQDVHRQAHRRGQADDQDRQAQDNHRIGVVQGKTNQPHGVILLSVRSCLG
jgi:hypothetical protein